MPAPTPTPANRPPTVTIAGADSCHPKIECCSQVIPCAIALRADAEDPDGDALSYAWSGCASGIAATARCTIDQLAEFTATLAVSDGHHKVTASKVVRGVNAVPTNQLSFTCVYFEYPPASTGTCLPANQPDCPPVRAGANVYCGSEPFGYLHDQEGDRIYCAEVTATGNGCYQTSYEDCGGHGGNATFEFGTPSLSTVCTYEAYMQDAWGAHFKVATFRLPVWR